MLTIPGLFTTSFLFLVVTLAFKKSLGQVLAWKSGLKVPLLTLLTAAADCYTRQDGQHCSLKTCHGVFIKSGETISGHNTAFIFDEYEKVNDPNMLIVKKNLGNF
jgi:hypothetical protein